MRKNRTARSETDFSSYKIGAIDVNIMLVTDYAVVYTPSSCNGHGILFFVYQHDHEHKCYFFTPQVTDCFRLILKEIINISLNYVTYALLRPPITMTGDVAAMWA